MYRNLLISLLFAYFSVIALPLLAQDATPQVHGACPVCEACPSCDPAEEKDKSAWDINLLFGFNYNSGNTDTNLLDFGARADREVNDHIYNIQLAHRFGESNDETNVDDSTARADYKHLLSERLYAGFGLGYTRDEIASVDYRVLIEPKLGYFFVKNEELKFSLEVGPGYVYEEVGNITDDYFSPFVGDRFDWTISETAKLFQQARLYLSVDDSENYLINAVAGLETKVTETVALITGLEFDYDNQPAAGLKEEDIRFITSISVGL